MSKIRCSTHYGKKLYKVLSKNGTSRNGGKCRWSLPKGNRPGAWHKIPKHLKLVRCRRGFHVTTQPRVWGGRHAAWHGGYGERNSDVRVFEVQVRQRMRTDKRDPGNKIIVRECRLLREVPCP